MDTLQTDEQVTLNIAMSPETKHAVMMAVFRYYQDILRAIEEVKHSNTEDDKKTREWRERICENLVAVLGDSYSTCAREYFM
jgi:hypothetical protein